MEYAGVKDSTLIILAVIAIVPPLFVAILNTVNHRETRSKIADNTTKTAAVLHQVKNDHSTNLRDDIDEFKREVITKLNDNNTKVDDAARALESIEAAQGYLGGIVGNILGDVRKLKRTDLESATAIEALQEAVKPLQEALDKYEQRTEKP